MRTHNLYPALDAPEFNQHGGIVLPGFDVFFSAAATVYYSTDGSDPRLPGGGINPSAYSASSSTTSVSLLQTGAAVRALVPTNAAVDATWFRRNFDDSTWTAGTTGVGYEAGSGYEAEISLDLMSEMHTKRTSAYLRIPFGGADPSAFQALTLKMKYDDGFIAYLNGVQIASRNPPTTTVDYDSQAGGSPSDAQALQFVPIDVTPHMHLLSPVANVLAIHGLNVASSSSDFLIVPELDAVTISGGDALSLNTTIQLRARAYDGSEWSALHEATFIVGIPPTATNLVVSEIMYHPGLADLADEFIEVMNISATDALDLTGVSFSDGIGFTFPLGFTLAPGQRAVVVADLPAFAAAHPGLAIAGTFSGALNNGGERVALSDSFGTEFLAFTYDNNPPWPLSPDGDGTSLVLIAPKTIPNHSLATSWRASTATGGNPTDSDRVPYSGGDLLAYALADHSQFDFQSMTFAVPLQPGSDDAEVIPQWSTDLQNWNEDRLEFLGGDPARWQIMDPPAGAPRLFLRLMVRTR
jgi:hypothetical protein